MVIRERAIKVEEVELDAKKDHPEVAPLFYNVPCAGVRYYTFDCRPALKKRISRWAEEDQSERLVDCG